MPGVSAKVTFIESRRPPLEAGSYRVKISHEISGQDGNLIPFHEPYAEREFSFDVAGPQLAIPPPDIAAVFPPPGSLGDHSMVFPHIAFTRTTLPWERTADPDALADDTSPDWRQQPPPWLALLLFTEEEINGPDVKVPDPVKPEELASKSVRFPRTYKTMPGEVERAAVLDVRTSLLRKLLPDALHLRLLCHVRGTVEGARESEYAYVVGSRLPQRGKISTVHLVSLEHRFKGGHFDFGKKESAMIRLVSLHQWRFSCEAHEHTFAGLLLNLNKIPTGSPNELRMPDTPDKETNRYLSGGFALLPHQFRNGARACTWYRGPLIPGNDVRLSPQWLKPTLAPTQDGISAFDSTRVRILSLIQGHFMKEMEASLPPSQETVLPARCADALLSFDAGSGLFHSGYAAAWELGRSLCLTNPRISAALFQWKRACRRQQLNQQEHVRARHRELPLPLPVESPPDMPSAVEEWLKMLQRLESVPFSWLVPDERMLPVESIRFLRTDPFWVNCLVDGAFSIGRVLDGDHAHDQDLHLTWEDRILLKKEIDISGFLLRSAAVSGWPLMEVEATAADGTSLKIARRSVLVPGILLCLFEGKVSTITIHLPAETLHFGLDENENGGFKIPDGTELDDLGILRPVGTAGKGNHPGLYSRSMVAGVPVIIFGKKPAPV